MNHNPKLNKLIKSIVALAMVLLLFVTATFAWLSASVSTNIDTSEFITISADAGLNMNYGYGDNNQGQMKFPSGCILKECSSADGRSLYFPLPAYGRNEEQYKDTNDIDFTNGIEYNTDLIFREATAIDKNKSYISLDLELKSDDDTSVWLDRSSYISSTKNPYAAQAVRVAFIEKKPDGNSIVFDNSQDKSFSEQEFNSYISGTGANYITGSPYFKPVSAINRKGESIAAEPLRPYSFNEFVQGNKDDNILFNLKAGETLYVTVNIWLEGTDPACTADALSADDLEIFIKFSTSYESMRTFYFKDYTLEKWVANDECFVFAQDTNDNLYPFTKSANYSNDYTWYGAIPESVTEVKFVRYNPNDSNIEWNYWDAGTIGDCATFNAFGHSAGMWSDTFSPTTITLFDGTSSGEPLWNVKDEIWLAHISFTITDGNGNESYHNYKLSYQWDYNQWQTVIPSQVTDINFYMYPYDESSRDLNNPSMTWTSTREDELYYTMLIDNETKNTFGYWSDEFIYINGASYTDDETIIATYFFDYEDSSYHQWVAARSITSNGHYKAAVPPQLMASNNSDSNPNTATVYFTDNQNWGNANIYFWNSSTTSVGWPGEAMTEAYINGYGQQVYKAEIPMDAGGIIFNNGSVQTVDITGYELYDGIGFYPNTQITSGNDNNKWTIGSYTSYKPGVIIARYAEWSEIWSWDKSSDGGPLHNQTSKYLATYGTNNLFSITGFDDNDDLTGEWSKTDNP